MRISDWSSDVCSSDLIACDIHPLNNLRVLKYLKRPLGHEQSEIDGWARHWMIAGFAALEVTAAASVGCYLFGDAPTLADVCLVPQLYNARRFDTELDAFPALVRVDAALNELPEIGRAAGRERGCQYVEN